MAVMASVQNNSNFSLYEFLFKDLADPRTENWFLMSSPLPGLILMVAYLLFVTYWGPRHMSQRKPVDLSSVLVPYNFSQVLLSAFLIYEALDGLMLRQDYSLKCQPLRVDRSKEAMREARCVYMYFLAKITELLDTVFFVFRKKTNQITFLHIYHHTIMPIISWGFCKYCPGGHVIFIVALNSFVHVVMYTYYLLAACGPRFQKYLWWKKYITLLQLMQFVIVAIHNLPLLFSDCNYPKTTLLFIMTNSLFFIYLFSDFYGKAYNKEAKNSTERSSTKGVKYHEN